MACVHDVAKYILNDLAPDGEAEGITAWKLQKLVYYCQAWSLVWIDQPLFPESFEAWSGGPACPDLYEEHKDLLHALVHTSDLPKGDSDALSDDEKETVQVVIKYYGHMTETELYHQTRFEKPWVEARGDTPFHVRSHTVITLKSMRDYYESIYELYENPEESVRRAAAGERPWFAVLQGTKFLARDASGVTALAAARVQCRSDRAVS